MTSNLDETHSDFLSSVFVQMKYHIVATLIVEKSEKKIQSISFLSE